MSTYHDFDDSGDREFSPVQWNMHRASRRVHEEIAGRNEALWRFLTDQTLSEAERREAFDRAFADRKGE